MLGAEQRLHLTAGFLQHRTKANWKFILENETDGYHPGFVHSSIFQVAQSGIANLYGADSTALTRDFGNGHTEFDLRPEWRRINQPLAWFGTSAEKLPDYTRAMTAAYGEERARQIMIDGSPHTMIFPNLFIAEIQMFVIQPITVDDVADHVVHAERYIVPQRTWEACQQARRVVAVGTTTVRALESAAATGCLEGLTDLYLRRGHRFAVVGALLTNFHVPRSSLLVLLDAFVGERWRSLYDTALAEGYRFLSLGDAMFLPGPPVAVLASGRAR